MKTAVATTSLAAYWALRDAGELPEKERIVYEAIVRNGPMTREQIASVTGMKEGSACGRVNRLLYERGMLERHAVKRNPITNKDNEVVWIAKARRGMVQMNMDLA